MSAWRPFMGDLGGGTITADMFKNALTEKPGGEIRQSFLTVSPYELQCWQEGTGGYFAAFGPYSEFEKNNPNTQVAVRIGISDLQHDLSELNAMEGGGK